MCPLVIICTNENPVKETIAAQWATHFSCKGDAMGIQAFLLQCNDRQPVSLVEPANDDRFRYYDHSMNPGSTSAMTVLRIGKLAGPDN